MTITSVLALAAIAAVVSYSHMYELALRHGEPPWRAALFPLSVDGMIVAASMTLLADARQGRRGGILPWTLLIVGSVASLASNIAVADPTVWSRIIHAWPSVALIGDYELLMRQLRAHALSEREAHAMRTQAMAQAGHDSGEQAADIPSEDIAGPEQQGLRVIGSTAQPDPISEIDHEAMPVSPPQRQREAWAWALDNLRDDGALPSGKEIGDAFDRKPRWGRLVKARGKRGKLGPPRKSEHDSLDLEVERTAP